MFYAQHVEYIEEKEKNSTELGIRQLLNIL